ncbi:hypothetical protein L5515_015781 [Caenorhabditis briggsae]|uniref:EGF-like domain-containing protein n=1 Tax=Caenorhabditis briggsae TaxID=6238 RepID=A0AAE9JAM3_CAEBR|nr:hypothetical protein L5515_015781 [Caenorhabditis briggsae]
MAIISVRTELHMCSKSCGFRGICYEASGTHLCRCPRGFIGDECDTLVNQLTLEPIGFGYCSTNGKMDDLSKWFERIHMDVIGPFMETKNAFPKFAVAKASEDQTSDT